MCQESSTNNDFAKFCDSTVAECSDVNDSVRSIFVAMIPPELYLPP